MLKCKLTKMYQLLGQLQDLEVLIDDKCVYDHGSFHSLGSPHSTSQLRLKIKSPPFVFLALLQFKTVPTEAAPLPGEDEHIVAPTALVGHCGFVLCYRVQHSHTQMLAPESAFGLQSTCG